MLNREHLNRQSGAAVYQDIAALFCGRCCLDIDSSSSADEDYQSDFDMLSDIMEHDDLSSPDPGMEPAYKLECQDLSPPLAEPFREDGDTSGLQSAQIDNVTFPSIERDKDIKF